MNRIVGIRTSTPDVVLVLESEMEVANDIVSAADALADAVEANINRGAAFITSEVQRALAAYRAAVTSQDARSAPEQA